MKKQIVTLLSLLLVSSMMLGVLVSCTTDVNNDTTATNAPEQTEAPTDGEETTAPQASESESNESESEAELETESGSESDTEQVGPTLEGEDAAIIEEASKLKNGVLTYYADSRKNSVVMENLNMTMDYGIKSKEGNMQITSLTDKEGHAYITNTMDVLLNMTDGSKYYASKSTVDASLNIYRYGYYYFENRIEGQIFTNGYEINNLFELNHLSIYSKNGLKGPTSSKQEEGIAEFQRTGSDPWVRFNMNPVNTADYDFMEITMRQDDVSGASDVFIIAGNATTFTSSQVYSFTPEATPEGEFVTYRIPLSEYNGYTGELKGIRVDVNTTLKAKFEIKSIKLYKADFGGAPTDLSIQRSFITYSDKLHQIVQFSTPKTVSGVDNVQIITKIAADTVNSFIVKDRKGVKTNLDEVIWQAVEYAGFDIKDAGIFGYILPCDEMGTLTITLENGFYVVTQTKKIEGGEFIPSTQGSRNANDVFMGSRVYTDSNHTFDAFIHEAECERNPLEADKNIDVNRDYDGADFKGYDPLYGYYKFTVKGTSFNPAYYTFPNKQFRVNFTVKSDKYDRKMYFMTYTANGGLECATLLDGRDMLLPVPLEVCKNFAGDGENTIYNLDDAAYGEVYFPIVVKAKETKEYTVTNLYQNWGRYPLKQISSIQFFTPYYHLSTGVTETNCIVQLATNGPGLPDHRAMSAPFWPTQPQHNSGGGHNFLSYTAMDGTGAPSDNKSAIIDSYGPTYCDITLEYEGADGSILAQYIHTEMPQTDENRAYYEMTYTFQKDITFEDFSKQFRFYNCTDNNPKGVYTRVGYLDENNECQVTTAISENDKQQSFVLGDECPYFTFFDMPDWDREYKHAFGYTNLSFLVYNYEVISNGEKIDTNFLLVNTKDFLKLTLNLKEVSFKVGDTITVNAILMPWGSQELDGTYDEVQDQMVRDVRENTLLNPLTPTAVNDCEVLESVYVPKLRTTNGKSAEFTLSGGHNNVAVRIYGFDKLTVPVIEELVDGEWKTYEVSSIGTPDDQDFGYYYDGYMVYYDGDGTYSYSFVTTMDNGAPRTFRISAEKDFEGWPAEVPSDKDEPVREDLLTVYTDAYEINKMAIGAGAISGVELADDESYVRLFANPGASEAYFNFYSSSNEQYKDLAATGQYAVIKYRLPASPVQKLPAFEIFTSTEHGSAMGPDRFNFGSLTYDGEWHVVILDLSKFLPTYVKPEADGSYKVEFLRIDFFNGKGIPKEMYVDFAYVGLCASLEEICELNSDMKEIILATNTGETVIDPSTGNIPSEEPNPTVFVDPSSGYTVTETPFASWIDLANGVIIGTGTSYDKDIIILSYNDKTIQNSIFTISGWVCAEGGVEKYVWSCDGGKTWNDVIFSNGRTEYGDATQAYFDAVTSITKSDYVIQDKEASKVNVRFQGSAGAGAQCPGIAADLSGYVGKTVNVTFAAVPKADTDSLCLIMYVKGIKVVAPENPGQTETTEPETSAPEVTEPETPEPEDPTPNNAQCEVIIGVEQLLNLKLIGCPGATATKKTDDGEYVRFERGGTSFGDGYTVLFTNQNKQPTGNYFIMKYRTDHMTNGELWANTEVVGDSNGQAMTYVRYTTDGEWHILVIDLAKAIGNYVKPYATDKYAIQWARIDLLNNTASSGYFDIAYILYCDKISDAAKFLDEKDAAYCTHIKESTYVNNNDGTHTPACSLCGTALEKEAHFPATGISYDSDVKKYSSTCPCGEKLVQDFIYQSEAYVDPIAHGLKSEKMSEGDIDFVRISATKADGDQYAYIYKNGTAITGQYMLIKYRFNNGGNNTDLGVCYFASVMSSNAQASGNGDGAFNLGTLTGDGEWNYIVIDLSKPENKHFIANADGTYSLKYLRIRYTVSQLSENEYTSLDIDFVAFADNTDVFSSYVEADGNADAK